jgi:uncharacterized membrane protein
MDLALWVLQVLLALGFLGAGYTHAFRFDTAARDRLTWMLAVGKDDMRVIGWLEMLGAIGLLLPALTGILTWLTRSLQPCSRC